MTARKALLVALISLVSCRNGESPKVDGVAAPAERGVFADSALSGGHDSSLRNPAGERADSVGGQIPASVFAYHEAFVRSSLDIGKLDLPALWGLEVQARKDLLDTLASLTDSAYALAESLMVWHGLNRMEFIMVEPFYDSFLVLAREHGSARDTSFFGYMADVLEPSGRWSWQRLVTDYSACDELGSPELFRSVHRFLAVGTKLPPPYSEDLPDPTKALRESLEYGVCACESQRKTLSDFETSLATTSLGKSDSLLLEPLRQRLRNPRPKDRFDCTPG